MLDCDTTPKANVKKIECMKQRRLMPVRIAARVPLEFDLISFYLMFS